MTTQDKLCSTIESIYPEIGSCNNDFKVYYEEDSNSWIVEYERNGHQLKTHVEISEADSCVEDCQCLPLGLQVGQLKTNFEQYIHEHALEAKHGGAA